jgi:hypothetical protein
VTRSGVRRAVAGLSIAAGLLVATPAPALALRSHPVRKPTLALIDRRCFYAPAPSASWPLAPQGTPHPIRSGFDDMHGERPMYAHTGVDVSTSIDRAKVYAMTSGVIGDEVAGGPFPHLRIGPFFYYHVIPRLPAGTYVARGTWIGRIRHRDHHVHVSEIEPGCGLVDPRRPTGPLGDPTDTEHPTVEDLTADVANAAAYRSFPAWRTPDRARPLALNHLRGVVDLRAEVFDMPVRHTHMWPQQPLMVAAVRSWLAPLTKTWRGFGRTITAHDGSTWISTTSAYYDVMAHGSVHVRSCFEDPSRACDNRYILHVAGRGLDTRRFPDRWYHYCVSALTIRDRRTTRCWQVRIQNHSRVSPTG